MEVIVSRNVKSKLNSANFRYETPLLARRLDNEDPSPSQNRCTNVLEESRNSKSIPVESSKNDDEEVAPRRSKQLQEQKQNCAIADTTQLMEPTTYKQAISSPDSEMWLRAMQDEMESLNTTGTYELTDLPRNRKAIGCRWVLKSKHPTMEARSSKLDLWQKVSPKSMARTMTKEMFMQQPEGFRIGDQVMRLIKSLYGLKQAARAWNILLQSSLNKFGLIQSQADDCLLIKKTPDGVLFLGTHVDDLIAISSSITIINNMAAQLGKDFELKDLGKIKQFLGVQVKRHDDGHFSINQEPYITKIAQKMRLEGCNPQEYPFDSGYYRLEDNTEYRKIIGKLLYVSTNTRPDISASVAILAQRVENPRKLDLNEAIRTMKYLISTKNHELHLNNANAVQSLTVFSDANFGECRLDGKSNSGVICLVNGGTVSWSSRKQSLVALSTCEAELQAVCEAVKEVIWLKRIIAEFEDTPPAPTIVYNGNQSTINMITSGNLTQRTKYIGFRCHFIQDWIKRGQIILRHCASEHNSADMFTKPRNSVKLNIMRRSACRFTEARRAASNENITILSKNYN